jgi:hypothetical protein
MTRKLKALLFILSIKLVKSKKGITYSTAQNILEDTLAVLYTVTITFFWAA